MQPAAIYSRIKENADASKKMLAFLVDPDKAEDAYLEKLCELAAAQSVDIFLVGGSLLTGGDLEACINKLKSLSTIPVIIFPGSPSQISESADALLFLSLLSSRNAEMLIGQQVVAAPYLYKCNIEVISTAYLLIDGGKQTTASYISNSTPIPADKSEIAAYTALAGQYLGMKQIYLDAGSGALNNIPSDLIKAVSEKIDIPLIVGGGIDNHDKIKAAHDAGADIVVIGNALEKGLKIFD
ncbi:MAG: geranylgeranylglyceryl/heptaprenylglyceryl phosphate synthase [Flavobacteriales bacterium]|nr:geranylgeranylglyceryl/heptaprenylglyceryl phosphate synthase [Flavobacteriales bacterium]|tara:strand:+ start:684 stop:1403 length:720 start_codon:yes stop_codon:yes gene_type:complete